MPRRDSRVVQNLRQELTTLGLDVSARRIERLGSAGLLGSYPYGPELLERTTYALELVARNEARLDLAVLAMFAERRYRISEAQLKTAFVLALERLETMIDKRLGPGDPVDAFRLPAATMARRSAKKVEGREIRERLRRVWPTGDSDRTILSLLEDLYLELLLVVRTGKASSMQGLLEVLEGTGVGAIASEHLPGRPPIVSGLPLAEIEELLSVLTLGGAARAVALASYADLEKGRDDALCFFEFANAFAPFARQLFGLPEAFGLAPLAEATPVTIAFISVGMMHLRSLNPASMDETKSLLELETPRFQARLELLTQIPDRLRGSLADPELVSALDESDRVELVSAIDQFAAEQPHLYRLATTSEHISE
jgi:hypothetical protein